MRSLIQGLVIALVSVGLMGGSPHSNISTRSASTPPGFEKGEKKGWQGKSHPPGWEKGKKKGWEGGATPPGKTPKE